MMSCIYIQKLVENIILNKCYFNGEVVFLLNKKENYVKLYNIKLGGWDV